MEWLSCFDVIFDDYQGICYTYERFQASLNTYEIATNSRYVIAKKPAGFFETGTFAHCTAWYTI